MPINPTGLGRNIKQTTGSGLPPNRRPQAPGIGATGPLNLAGPPKMPSPRNGVNTSKPMGMPVAPPMLGGQSMPLAPDNPVKPQIDQGGMVMPPVAPGPTGTQMGFGGGRFGTDMLVAPPGYGQSAGPVPGPGQPGYSGVGPQGQQPVQPTGRDPRLPPMNINPFGGMTR